MARRARERRRDGRVVEWSCGHGKKRPPQKAAATTARRRERVKRHASPRKMVAGRTLTRRRRGYAPRMATMTGRATEIGYTMRRGAAATPKTALPKAMERGMAAAAPHKAATGS